MILSQGYVVNLFLAKCFSSLFLLWIAAHKISSAVNNLIFVIHHCYARIEGWSIVPK